MVAVEVDAGDAEVGVPSCRRMTRSGMPSCAISTAWECRSGYGANRRVTPGFAVTKLRLGVEFQDLGLEPFSG